MALDALPTSFAKCLRGLDLARELLDVLLLSVPNFLHCDFALRVFIGATPWEVLPRLSAASRPIPICGSRISAATAKSTRFSLRHRPAKAAANDWIAAKREQLLSGDAETNGRLPLDDMGGLRHRVGALVHLAELRREIRLQFILHRARQRVAVCVQQGCCTLAHVHAAAACARYGVRLENVK